MIRFQLYRSGLIRKEWRWRMRAANGRIIADSGEGYRNKADCIAAIDLIREGAAGAAVRDTAVPN